ncbi:VCBS repeat-containing protein [Streptomyces sp. CC208A]|uniref:FG-GAP repeat domain-containing protein n=1 Tax=Streptomyces sp. CC208A TaxID=3044573 RepID=UPI0024A9C295|nr:VCBS repeat-containing protein [Streptomyces sp. CC208A]
MKHLSPAAGRLALAVTVALAVTAGGLAAPAFAAGPATPVTVRATAETAAPLTVPVGSVVVSTGRTGMLTRTGTGTGTVHRWTRHADGVTTTLPAGAYWGSPGTDLVVSQSGTVYTLTDMGGAADPVVIDTSVLGAEAAHRTLRQVVGSTLVMSGSVDGVARHHLVSLEAGKVVSRTVPLSAGWDSWRDYVTGPGTFAVILRSPGTASRRLGVVDVATGEIVESYALRYTTSVESVTLTPTHIAWAEDPYSVNKRMVVAPRGTDQVQSVPWDSPAYANGTVLHALGDWVAYTKPGGGTALFPNDLHPVAVRSVRTGESFPLLDHASSLVPDGDGGLLAVGGTVAHGEGLYRIALDAATGKPAATLVRTSHLPTALTVVKETLPPTGTFDFDRAGGGLPVGWTLSRFNAKVSLTLTHTASGRTVKIADTKPDEGVTTFPLAWNGLYRDGLPAYNGAYTWTMRAEPANGIGPAVERKGTFTLTRAPRPRDFDGNGSPDVLSLYGGYLFSYDLRQLRNRASSQDRYEVLVGGGWQVYDRITPTGNIGGTRDADLVARDRSGVLWVYEGKGTHKAPFAPRTRIGGGWQVYDKLTGGSDLTGDGRNDLLAADKSGVLWLYPGTGNAKAPFKPRVKIGGGWQTYNQITATGNLAGAAAGDLVARDRAGVLWLYLGKGDGTFAPRTRIGGGWQHYQQILGVGDLDGDGRNDLVAEYVSPDPAADSPQTSLLLHRGTGRWATPFAARQHVGSLWSDHQLY